MGHLSIMRFLIDENVQTAIILALTECGHDAVRATEILETGAADPLVATAAVENDRILVSHDNDMRRIERKISETHRERFPSLCRLMFCLPEPEALARLLMFLPLVELEFQQARQANQPMMLEICARRIRIHR
ncbi:DUF5615 family PIN-like protein [Sphingorhabdus sp.]|uniref:DUF5615 family PIN-like protein n=1 Tax=Sphingorhabdus sp. TaxID=1902408 RepID=UPI003D818E6B